jgi:glycosyltransferase involved in cell wall biosynthesis
MFRRAEIAKGLYKRIFFTEGKRLSEYENRIYDYFNSHVIISESDRDLINHPSKDEIMIIENGIDPDFFEYSGTKTADYELLFTGNMNYPPNIECSEFIVHKILTDLPADMKLLLAGASPNQRIVDMAIEGKIKITGWIDDIRDAYASGKIFVAPLFIGTGLQNKLLEAMAMGLPCITSSLANNALNATPNEHLLIADNPQEYVAHIKKLLSDESFYQMISNNGKSFVKQSFSWEKSVQKLEELLIKQ